MLHDSIWRHRDLRLMIPARAVSAFGDDMALLVLMLRVYGEGRGPWSIVILLLCATVPIVVLAPVAGRLVDAAPFRTVATCSAGWQAGCCIALAFVDPLWAVYGLVVVLQVWKVYLTHYTRSTRDRADGPPESRSCGRAGAVPIRGVGGPRAVRAGSAGRRGCVRPRRGRGPSRPR